MDTLPKSFQLLLSGICVSSMFIGLWFNWKFCKWIPYIFILHDTFLLRVRPVGIVGNSKFWSLVFVDTLPLHLLAIYIIWQLVRIRPKMMGYLLWQIICCFLFLILHPYNPHINVWCVLILPWHLVFTTLFCHFFNVIEQFGPELFSDRTSLCIMMLGSVTVGTYALVLLDLCVSEVVTGLF